MVHALENAGRFLRPGGALVDLQPDRSFAARVGVVANGGRAYAGPFVFAPDPAVADAHAALDRVVARGAFRVAREERVRYRTTFRSLRELDAYLGSRDVRPRFAPGTRARLVALWRSAPSGARIELERAFTVRILRRA